MPFPPWRAAEPSGLTAWRITSARFAGRPFDGEGARLFGGRWNHPGTPLVYASETLSLSALEYFVHLDPSLAPRGLVMAAAEIPPGLGLQEIEASALRGDWRSYPAPEALKDIGTAWVRSGEGAVLLVPSCIIPAERNVLLNPAHPDFGRIRIVPVEPFAFDPRMWK
jgi:RES domain-containing protein